MAIGYFTRLCAFFRSSLNKPLLFWLYRSSPVQFNQILALRLCGRHVFVSCFSSHAPIGWYFVSSIIIDCTGSFELGLGFGDDVVYYHFSDIDVTEVR